MPRPRKSVPTYRKHKQSGQAVVTSAGVGGRRDCSLGKFDCPESHEQYRRVVAAVRAGRPASRRPAPPRRTVSVNEVLLAVLAARRTPLPPPRRHPDAAS